MFKTAFPLFNESLRHFFACFLFVPAEITPTNRNTIPRGTCCCCFLCTAKFRVAFDCQGLNKLANECLHQFSSNEQYLEYRMEKKKGWIAEGKLRADTPLP